MESQTVGIFVDAENVPGLRNCLFDLMTEMTVHGPIVVRRAYANWTHGNMADLQRGLTELGFELVHTFHPISRKNSSDIHMAVDVLHTAIELVTMQWIVLVTGDSDFSPLFRRLREMGRKVVGAGPRSVLSEMVKHSCTRFIYYSSSGLNENRQTEEDGSGEAPGVPDAATEGAEQSSVRAVDTETVDMLRRILRRAGGRLELGGLKSQLLLQDPAFDERAFGYGSFYDFIEGLGEFKVGRDGNAVYAELVAEIPSRRGGGARAPAPTSSPYFRAEPSEQVYAGLLRKKGWAFCRRSLLRAIYDVWREFNAPLPLPEAKDAMLKKLGGQATGSEIRSGFGVILKSGTLEKVSEPDEQGERPATYRARVVQDDDAIWDLVDRAMMRRLVAALEEYEVPWEAGVGALMLVGERTDKRAQKLYEEEKAGASANG